MSPRTYAACKRLSIDPTATPGERESARLRCEEHDEAARKARADTEAARRRTYQAPPPRQPRQGSTFAWSSIRVAVVEMCRDLGEDTPLKTWAGKVAIETIGMDRARLLSALWDLESAAVEQGILNQLRPGTSRTLREHMASLRGLLKEEEPPQRSSADIWSLFNDMVARGGFNFDPLHTTDRSSATTGTDGPDCADAVHYWNQHVARVSRR